MSLFYMFKYGLWRLLETICSKLNLYIFIKTRTGLKSVNINRLYSDNIIEFTPDNMISVDPNNLFLSTDYLKDDYTLLDCCILDSPHYSFIEAVNNGKDIRKTDYYKRFLTGKLDGRHCQRERNLSYFYDKNIKAKESVESGNYKPVVVYLWKGHYYICDGKHRAALCAFMKRNVNCILAPSISDFSRSAINKEIYRIMAGDKHFSKHINYLNDGEK